MNKKVACVLSHIFVMFKIKNTGITITVVSTKYARLPNAAEERMLLAIGNGVGTVKVSVWQPWRRDLLD